MIIRGLCNWWAIANDRKQAVARIAYILRYSIAKVYAAKFKTKTVARTFKLGGNDLSRPTGAKKKSAVGVIDKPNTKIPGILYDRYHKIPKRAGSKLLTTWKPGYLKALENNSNIEDFIRLLNESKASNPLRSLKWRLQKSLWHQGAPCDVCGSFDDVQVHHIKALKDMKPIKSKLSEYIRGIQSPQIALCRKHHLEIHKVSWHNSPVKPR
jgi:hypothetical protein